MTKLEPHNIDSMINQWLKGNRDVENELFQTIYPTLRKIVQKEHRKINIQDMNTTLLVNEVYIKFKQNDQMAINDERHLYALATRIIRFFLIDSLKHKATLKQGNGHAFMTWRDEEMADLNDAIDFDLYHLHELLNELEAIDQEAARMIDLRFFGGLNISETAHVMNTSRSHVSRNWKFAKTWLQHKLKNSN